MRLIFLRYTLNFIPLASTLFFCCSFFPIAHVSGNPVLPSTPSNETVARQSILNVTIFGMSLSAYGVTNIRQSDRQDSNAYHFVDDEGETLFTIQRDDTPSSS
ncbi:hypothetical protein B0H11DRAFT_2216512 [Mycena galericulata]|nr:hypothetical protein B0H11DRAFT_2216512 [Mycena galericulata]